MYVLIKEKYKSIINENKNTKREREREKEKEERREAEMVKLEPKLNLW